jgi:hypothetical protein
MSSKGYTIVQEYDAGEVPTWVRRQPKYTDLVEAILKLKPGQTLKVIFDNGKIATTARNTIRDHINMDHLNQAAVRTRLEKKEDNSAVVWFTRLKAEQIVEAEE